MADFGLVGLPNAGKSSMLRYLTNATPDISDIPGTTLVPHLGKISYKDDFSLTIADLPGKDKNSNFENMRRFVKISFITAHFKILVLDEV